MFRKLVALSAVFMVSLGFSSISLSAEEGADTATVVVYRAEESHKTSRLGLDVHVGEGSLGRLKSEQTLVFTRPAGEYTLDTSMKGTQPLVLDLKAGQTYYVHTEMDMKGTLVYVQLKQVAEQVARVQQPSLDLAI